MTHEPGGPRDCTSHAGPADLEKVLFGDNADVRAQFQHHFGDLVRDFLRESYRAYFRLRDFGQAVARDRRAAWTDAFLFSAFNSALTSCHLLISGFPIPAGNLMRHYGESSAMALLCSHRAIDVFQRLDDDPARFSVSSAVQII